MMLFFFFQAEDGIRDTSVTGVQTCALPISLRSSGVGAHGQFAGRVGLRKAFDDRLELVEESSDLRGHVGGRCFGEGIAIWGVCQELLVQGYQCLYIDA